MHWFSLFLCSTLLITIEAQSLNPSRSVFHRRSKEDLSHALQSYQTQPFQLQSQSSANSVTDSARGRPVRKLIAKLTTTGSPVFRTTGIPRSGSVTTRVEIPEGVTHTERVRHRQQATISGRAHSGRPLRSTARGPAVAGSIHIEEGTGTVRIKDYNSPYRFRRTLHPRPAPYHFAAGNENAGEGRARIRFTLNGKGSAGTTASESIEALRNMYNLQDTDSE